MKQISKIFIYIFAVESAQENYGQGLWGISWLSVCLSIAYNNAEIGFCPTLILRYKLGHLISTRVHP